MRFKGPVFIFAGLLLALTFQNCGQALKLTESSSTSTAERVLNADVCETLGQDDAHCPALKSIYQEELSRQPGYEEISYWENRIAAEGLSLTDVSQLLAKGPEATALRDVTAAARAGTRKLEWGPWLGGIPSEKNVALESTDDFNAMAGKPASLMGYNSWWHVSQPWGDFNTSVKGWMEEVVSKGATPVILWNPIDMNHGLRCSDPGYIEIIRKFSNRSIAAGTHDTYLRNWARQARAWGKPFVLRPFHELNHRTETSDPCTFVSTWGADIVVSGERINSPEDAIKAWRHVVGIFRAEGATNVKFMWSVLSWPSVNYGGNNPISLKSIYPGDDVVDWIGIECYNFSTTDRTSCAELMRGAYAEAAALSPTLPLINIEMGAFASPWKADWLKDALDPKEPQSIFAQFPRLNAFMYWQDSRMNALWVRSDKKTESHFRTAVNDAVFAAGSGGGMNDTKRRCSQDGTTLPHAAVAYFYPSPSSANCQATAIARGCNDGLLLGDVRYEFSTCSAAPLEASTAERIVVREMKRVFERTDAENAGDTVGIAFWVKQLQQGLSIDEFIQRLKNSDEAFVREAYVTHLKRKGDPAGVKFYVAELTAGRMTRAQVAAHLQAAFIQENPVSDALARATVIGLMKSVLGRTTSEIDGDPTGVTYWINRMKNGTNAALIEAAMRDSDELYIRSLYQSILGRRADIAGVKFYVAEIVAGRKTRAQVEADLRNICSLRIGGECS